LSSTLSEHTIPYSSSLAALSSVAAEELVEFERREALRRAHYEAARAELEARVTQSAGTSPDSTPSLGPKHASAVLPQHSVYCDGDSLTGLGGLTPRLPSCHHEECHKSYRTLLKMANRLGTGGSHTTQELPSPHYPHADGGHSASHAHTPIATNQARIAHRHHPYEIPQYAHQPGRKTSPVDTPSPISTDDSTELPALPPADNYTPSTSPFLRAVRNMNVGRSRTSSRVPSRAPSPISLHLPPAATAASSYDSGRPTIRQADRQHRTHRSHPSLSSPQDAPSEHQRYPHHHSHGGTPPETPSPLTMMGRPKRANSGGLVIYPPKRSPDVFFSGSRREPLSADATSQFAIDAPTPPLSSSSNSSTSWKPRHFDSASGETSHNPPLSFPPPPNRSRASSDLISPARSLAGSPEAISTLHSVSSFPSSHSHPPLPSLVPGLPIPSLSSSLPRSSASSLSSPSTPGSSPSYLAHSVRIAFGMTPIHPPNYFSSRGRSTIGFGNSSVRGSARSQSPPIILPPLKLGAMTEDNSSHGSEDGRESEHGHADLKLPRLDSLTRLVQARESLYAHDRTQDDMDIDDLH
jgi:zinc-finger protein CreA/MIG